MKVAIFISLTLLVLSACSDKPTTKQSIILDEYVHNNSAESYDQWYYDSSSQVSIEKDDSLWNEQDVELLSKSVETKSVTIKNVVLKEAIYKTLSYPLLSENHSGTLICILNAEYPTLILSPDDNSNYTYQDVIELECSAESNVSVQVSDGREFKNLKNYDTFKVYFAKNLGEVAYENRDCHYRYAEDLDDNIVDDTLKECSYEQKVYRYLKQ